MIASKKENTKAADEKIAIILKKIGDYNSTRGFQIFMVNGKFIYLLN